MERTFRKLSFHSTIPYPLPHLSENVNTCHASLMEKNINPPPPQKKKTYHKCTSSQVLISVYQSSLLVVLCGRQLGCSRGLIMWEASSRKEACTHKLNWPTKPHLNTLGPKFSAVCKIWFHHMPSILALLALPLLFWQPKIKAYLSR